MRLNKDILKGFFLALLLTLLSLFLINVLWAKEGDFFFFLSSTLALKSLVGYLSLAAIPAIAAFIYFIQNKKDSYAQGILYFLFLLIGLLIYIKFSA